MEEMLSCLGSAAKFLLRSFSALKFLFQPPQKVEGSLRSDQSAPVLGIVSSAQFQMISCVFDLEHCVPAPENQEKVNSSSFLSGQGSFL